MDFLRSQLAIVQDRLAGLSASQKMLAGALAVILVMTMLYWGKFASGTERVALMGTPVAGEELTQLTKALKDRGIDVTVENGRVMVPASQQIDAMGEASYGGLVPASTTNALDSMLDKITPWATAGQFSARMTSAKNQYLGAILCKWPGVQGADVFINEAAQASITRRDPTLTVAIRTKPGAPVNRRQMAGNARQFMQRCISGLKPENIAIAIDGATMVAGGDSDSASLSNDLLAIKREAEGDWLTKLRNQFSPITGILISVNVEVDNSSSTEKKREVDGKGKISEAQMVESEAQRPVGPVAPQQEPGVVANVAIDANGSAAPPSGPSGFETEKNKTTNVVDYGTKVTDTTKPGGGCTIVGATISVPRSYFVALWRQRQKGADAQKEPTDEELKPIVDNVTATIKRQTVAVTGVKDEARISVTDIWDLEPIVGGPILAAAATGAGGEFTALATGHAKEVALSILAVASLFMVSRMVKKAEPIALNLPALAGGNGLALAGMGGDFGGDGSSTAVSDGGSKRKSSSGPLTTEDIAGEVGGENGGAVMMGQELDPEVLETSQMIEQVSSFVKQNPDAAAQMVSRWMSRDD